MLSKAADTAKMGAALGPWIVANREAGELQAWIAENRAADRQSHCPRSRRTSRPSRTTRQREWLLELKDGILKSTGARLMRSGKVGAVGFCWGGRYVSAVPDSDRTEGLVLMPVPHPRAGELARPRRCGYLEPPL